MYEKENPQAVATVRHVYILFIAPESPEPYLALATAYEETGEKDKLLQVSV